MTDTIDGYAIEVSTDELCKLGTATLYEASGLDCDLPARLRPVWPGAVAVGRALPVRVVPGDNLALHLAVAAATPDDIIVADAGNLPYGYWGEILAWAAVQAGVRGLVIDGGVRDVDRLRSMGFPVFSSSVSVTRTVKKQRGEVGGHLRIGDCSIHPGALVIADVDGVIAIPEAHISETLQVARKRELIEAQLILELRKGGHTTIDLLNLEVPALQGTSK